MMFLSKLLFASLIAAPGGTQSIPGKLHIIRDQNGVLGCEVSNRDKIFWESMLPPSGDVQFLAQPTADIRVTYEGFTTSSKNAFQRAVDIWAKVLSAEIPIRIEAKFTSFEDQDSLAVAGAKWWFSHSHHGNTVWIPIALKNQHVGTDLKPDDPDITVSISSDHTWYYGVDGDPVVSSFDFVSVVLHEIGHGLGFTSSFAVDDSGDVQYGWEGGDETYITVYDTEVMSQDYIRLGGEKAGQYDLSDDNIFIGLTSHRLFWFGIDAYATNGGPVMLWAPGDFSGGSSVSHLDENAYPEGSPDELMTPKQSKGSFTHSVGPVTRAMFTDMGWTIRRNTIFLPSFLTGEELGSKIMVANQHFLSNEVILEALDSYGNEIPDIVSGFSSGQVSFWGGPNTTSTSAVFAQYESRIFEIDSPDSQWGSIRISSEYPISASLIWTWNGTPFDVEPSSPEFREALVPVEIGPENTTFIDLHNTEVRSQTVELRLRNLSGSLASNEVLDETILANGLVSIEIKDGTFSDLNQEEFVGTVHVTATGGEVAAFAIGVNESETHRIQISPILE